MPRFCITGLVLALLAGGAAQAEPELSSCTLRGSLGVSSIEARCGWLERLENPDDPRSPTIALRFAVIESLSPSPRPDAFTLINGGPGGSSLDLYADMAGSFAAILRERDILLLDQRGTGASNPLDCPQLDELALQDADDVVREAARACLAELPGDPRFYTTSVAVGDLEALREALGYAALNVYGVSYGTRVAQHYARRFPTAVRTLIIDGVAPPEVPLGPNAAINGQRVLDRLFDRCQSEPACAARFPALEAQLAELAARLKAGGVPLQIAHPVTGNLTDFDLHYDHLLLTLRMLSYAPETASLLPLIIDEAEARENYAPLATSALRVEKELMGAIRFGMHNSVICAEDVPFIGDLDVEALEATYIGPDQAQALIAICDVWPAGPVDDDLREPLESSTPTLILSGTEDPITPPAYGERAAAYLPNSLHLVGAGQGHGVVGRGCFPQLVSEFVDTADLSSLEAGCVDRLTDHPFFLNLMGPVPAAAEATAP